MEFELLTESHSAQLLEFEIENREWFERWIAPRELAFYSVAGVMAHIQSLQAAARESTALSFVATEDNHIIARANLKNICADLRTAEIGYRVAMKSAGAGVATACVAKLIEESTCALNIGVLRARVLHNNLASCRVLEKHAFVPTRYEPGYHEIKGVALGCTMFERRL